MRRDRHRLNRETRYTHALSTACQCLDLLKRDICFVQRKRIFVETTPYSYSVLQLTLRVKALKRQVDEGETELERIDGLRRKAQRDMEEQMELKEALQARVTALEAELK